MDKTKVQDNKVVKKKIRKALKLAKKQIIKDCKNDALAFCTSCCKFVLKNNEKKCIECDTQLFLQSQMIEYMHHTSKQAESFGYKIK